MWVDSFSISLGADKATRSVGAGDTEAELTLVCGELTDKASTSALGLLCHSSSRGRLLRNDWILASRLCAFEWWAVCLWMADLLFGSWLLTNVISGCVLVDLLGEPSGREDVLPRRGDCSFGGIRWKTARTRAD